VPPRRPTARSRVRRRLLLLLSLLALGASLSGAALGYFLRFDLPDVRALEDYEPPQMSQVLAADGTPIGTFHEQRRIVIDLEDIPPVFRQALVASEDAGFYRHTGIDFRAVARAAWHDLRKLEAAEGASTITQQLARNLFLTPRKTIRRKLEEALLALEIERQYAKDEILRFYCNQIYMGHGRYGLEAAARYYFATPSRELSLSQAATLAGLIQRPETLSPLRHADRALRRREYVLRRMVDTGALSPEEAEAAGRLPLGVVPSDGRDDLAPHFVEEIRRWLQQRAGDDSLYSKGLEVRSTLDPVLQRFAQRAVDAGLRELDKRQGWRGVAARVPPEADPLTWEPEGWVEDPPPGAVVDAVVIATLGRTASVRVGRHRGELGPQELAWTGRGGAFLHTGDVVRVRLVELDEAGGARLALEQEPEVEAALVAIDPASGAIRALVGGHDYRRSEFDRAMQARRQTGSAFKPFVYAAALSSGLSLADTLLDEPTVFVDPGAPEPYQPENYEEVYYGSITLRTALEKSANVATVKLLDRIGYDAVIEMARGLGIGSKLKPYPSLALGAFETTLLELTAAYGALANRGVWVEPHLVDEVRDRDGRPLYRIDPEVREAVTPQIAYLMTTLLAGVITDGTGRSAASLGLPLAGKTGTTDENTDAWFIGFAPGLAVGVWVGYDERRSLGRGETGAHAALPIWKAFMESAAPSSALDGDPPPAVTLVEIDRRTGLRANPHAYCRPVIAEAFLAGTEPTRTCSVEEHQRLRLPYPFQRYPLDDAGSLAIPASELALLLQQEPSVRVADHGRRLEAHLPDEVVALGLSVVPDAEPAVEPPHPPVPPDGTAWVGKDGRPARVVWIAGPRRAAASSR